jgi:hypothetical protein
MEMILLQRCNFTATGVGCKGIAGSSALRSPLLAVRIIALIAWAM